MKKCIVSFARHFLIATALITAATFILSSGAEPAMAEEPKGMDLTVVKTTEDQKSEDFVFRIKLLFRRYSVAIMGIGVDTLSYDGGTTASTAGLTFGPAADADYRSANRSHTPFGQTKGGNPHRCVHNDNWATIIQWNSTDPYVYEQCVGEGCTHSVTLKADGDVAPYGRS